MLSIQQTRPVWAEINLDNLAHNIKEVRRATNDNALVTAVVKADAYGHGSVAASKVFLDNGADRLAVATLSEAIELRENNIDAPILVLGYTPEYQVEDVIKNNVIQTIYNFEQAKAISDCSKAKKAICKIHIKIDTGMGRLGFYDKEEAVKEISKIKKLPNIDIEGIFTHFAVADEVDKRKTIKQIQKFNWIINKLEDTGIDIPIKHVSNSAAIIDLPEYSFNMVRAGIMLYGLYPSPDVNKERVHLKPAMTLKAKVSNVKEVEPGTGISYGHIFVTDRKTRVATLPLGYADGYTRMLTGKAEASFNGNRVPIIGKICMDQCMIDATEIEDVKIGDEVILFGDGQNNTPHIDEIAEKLGTINYEIVCMISRRVPRVYVKSEEIIEIKDYLLA